MARLAPSRFELATASQLQDIISDRAVHVNGFKCRHLSRCAVLGLIAPALISLYSRSATRLLTYAPCAIPLVFCSICHVRSILVMQINFLPAKSNSRNKSRLFFLLSSRQLPVNASAMCCELHRDFPREMYRASLRWGWPPGMMTWFLKIVCWKLLPYYSDT